MILLGITGPIGHGKTTLASFLAQQNPQSYQTESSQVIAEVADRLNKFFLWEAPTTPDINSINRWLAHLPAIITAVTHSHVELDAIMLNEYDLQRRPQDFEKLFEYIELARRNPGLLTEHITTYNKEAYRPLLQWLGGYLVKFVKEGIWYDELVRRASMAETYGCQLFIVGGLRFPSDAKILRHASGKVIKIVRPGTQELDRNDSTERERDAIEVDATITNDGDLDDLLQCSMRIYNDLVNNKLKKTYRASAKTTS